MTISNGSYVSQPHIGIHLQDFPDENLSKKQIQQFLDIVSYVSEFVLYLNHLTKPL